MILRGRFEMLRDKEFVAAVVAGKHKFHIKPKRDLGKYGYWIPEERRSIKTGYVVVGSDCTIVNRMPGATWFRTIAEAMDGIRDLIQAEGDPARFWELIRARRAA
jgi:hypothetical protein